VTPPKRKERSDKRDEQGGDDSETQNAADQSAEPRDALARDGRAPPVEKVLIRTHRTAKSREGYAEHRDGGSAPERKRRGANAQKNERQAHDEKTGPDGAEDGEMPRRVVIEWMPRNRQRDPQRPAYAKDSGRGEQSRGASTAHLDIALQRRENSGSNAFAQIRWCVASPHHELRCTTTFRRDVTSDSAATIRIRRKARETAFLTAETDFWSRAASSS